MKMLAVALLGAGLVIAQTSPVTGAYERGVQLGNQQIATAVDCMNHPSCIAAVQEAQARKDQAEADKRRLKAEAQARKDQAKAEKERLKTEAQARKDQAKADKERQKTEIKLAQLRLQQEREAARARAKSGPVASATP
jgi:Skp family chaperone for outer membrane proteins